VRQTLASVAGLGLVLAIAALFARDFYASANLVLVAQQIGFIGVAALGQTFTLLLGGIDLSVGAVSGLTMVVVAVVSGGRNDKLLEAILLAFALGIAVGIGNAVLVTWRNAPPFVATFATFTLVEGALLAWTKGAPSGNIPGSLGSFGAGSVASIPVPLIVFAGLGLACAFALGKTTYGRQVYATGSNPTAARLAAIPTRAVITSAYVVCALFAVVAGLLISGYIGYVDNQLVGTINLNCIAAAVIGGTTFAGGEGGVARTTIGVVLLACLLSLMVFFNAGISGQLILEGGVILGAVWLQSRGRQQQH
jgi:ribose/xylose/arabinose/galactoside ABC-type transport system permease subunit